MVKNLIYDHLSNVLSGVPQGAVLGPILFLVHINDISENITSNIRVFADDCLCYREIDSLEDCDILQQDINKLSNWAQAWGMRFQHVKCNMMTLSRKNYSIRFQYTLLDTPLEFFQSIKYLGVHISNNLTWNKHIEETCNKA